MAIKQKQRKSVDTVVLVEANRHEIGDLQGAQQSNKVKVLVFARVRELSPLFQQWSLGILITEFSLMTIFINVLASVSDDVKCLCVLEKFFNSCTLPLCRCWPKNHEGQTSAV